MTASNFARALELVLAHEGGYADHPRDPGGATNLGITHATLARWRGRPVSRAEVRALGRAEASEIYRALYWNAVSGDDLPSGLDLAVFDYAVNSGPARAAKAVQKLTGTTADGRIGPRTLEAIAAVGASNLIKRISDERRAFLSRLKTFAVFGKGWSARVDRTEREALIMAGTPVPMHTAGEQPMNDSKSILASRSVWGALVAIAAQLTGMADAGAVLPIDGDGDLIVQVVGVIGAIIALVGRFTAKTRLR